MVRDGLGAADEVGVGRHVAGSRGHGLGVQRQEAASLGQVLRQHRAGLGLGGGDIQYVFRYFLCNIFHLDPAVEVAGHVVRHGAVLPTVPLQTRLENVTSTRLK